MSSTASATTTTSAPQKSSETKYPAWVDVVSGGLGGALAKSLLCPFQRVVVLQQLGQHRELNTFQLAGYVYQKEGIKGFWRGNLTSMIIRVPYSGIQFLLYTKVKFSLQDWLARRKQGRTDDTTDVSGQSSEMFEKFIMKCGAGGVSATIAGAAVYPGEVVRLRLMSGEKHFNGIFNTVRIVYRETNSIRNFYRGLGASLVQRVPDILISFATYETVKYGILDHPHSVIFPDNYQARNVASTMIGGAMAALASIAVAFPLDVAKRRIGMSGQGGDKTVYKGVVDCLRQLYVKDGIRSWYAGATMEAVRCMPQVVLMWFFIEGMQKYLMSHVVVPHQQLAGHDASVKHAKTQ